MTTMLTTDSDWHLYYTDDGYPYYLNLVTKESIWAEFENVDNNFEYSQNIDQSEYQESSYSSDKTPYKLYPVIDSAYESLQSQRSNDKSLKNNSLKTNSKDAPKTFCHYVKSDEGMKHLKDEIAQIENKFFKKSSHKSKDEIHKTPFTKLDSLSHSYYKNDNERRRRSVQQSHYRNHSDDESDNSNPPSSHSSSSYSSSSYSSTSTRIRPSKRQSSTNIQHSIENKYKEEPSSKNYNDSSKRNQKSKQFQERETENRFSKLKKQNFRHNASAEIDNHHQRHIKNNTHSDMNDDIESMSSEDMNDDDKEFEELLKSEYFFDIKWQTAWNNFINTTVGFGNSLREKFTKSSSKSSQSSQIIKTHIDNNSDGKPVHITTYMLAIVINAGFFFLSTIVSIIGILTNEMFQINWKQVLTRLDNIDLQVQEWIKTIDNPNYINYEKSGNNKHSNFDESDNFTTSTKNAWNNKKNSSNSLYESDSKSATCSPSSATHISSHSPSTSQHHPCSKNTRYRECIDECDFDDEAMFKSDRHPMHTNDAFIDV